MGGIGSGSRWSTRTTTEEVKRVDIRYMHKHGMLRPGYSGSLAWSCGGEPSGSIRFTTWHDHLILNYRYRTYGSDWEDMDEYVQLERTPCNYGGTRPWLLCPRCGRRVAILYGADVRFLCRHCYSLPYSSQSEGRLDRANRKARRLRERLGASYDNDHMILEKPKGMHWRTFMRLYGEQQEAESEANALLADRLARWLDDKVR